MQKPDGQTFAITSENIRQSWYFDTQIDNYPRFLVMKNATEWQDFWHNTLPDIATPAGLKAI